MRFLGLYLMFALSAISCHDDDTRRNPEPLGPGETEWRRDDSTIVRGKTISLIQPYKPRTRLSVAERFVDVFMRGNKSDRLNFGTFNEVTVTVKNISPWAMVILSIAPQQGESEIKCFGSVYGDAGRNERTDIYTYNPATQMETLGTIFYAFFLLPRQSVLCEMPYRPLSRNEILSIVAVTPKEVYKGSSNSLLPLRVYVPGAGGDTGRTNYTPFSEQNWLNLCAKEPTTSSMGSGAPRRAVIIPDLGTTEIECRVNIPLTLEDGPLFTIDEARARAAAILGSANDIGEIYYSAIVKAYAIWGTTGVWFLKDARQEDRGESFPLFPSFMLSDLEKQSVRVRIGEKQDGFGPDRHDAGWKYWDIYPVVYGDGMYTRGEFIEISGEQLLDFLRGIAKRHQRLFAQNYFFGSRYYILESPK